MKYDWAKFNNESRKLFAQHVSFDSVDPVGDQANFVRLLCETDNFHPFYSDAEFRLSDIFSEFACMPQKCNYRSIDSYWQWREAKQELIECVREWFLEMYAKVEDYYLEKRNFPDCYIAPKHIAFDVDSISNSAIIKLMGRCK